MPVLRLKPSSGIEAIVTVTVGFEAGYLRRRPRSFMTLLTQIVACRD
jgi:hypothetical protein